MKEIIDMLKGYLKQETKLKVIMDPQPIKGAEPHLRLTFVGSGNQGASHCTVSFQLTIVGAGDGPEVFLDRIIEASLAVSDLYNSDMHEGRRYADIKLVSGRGSFRVNFPDTINNSGQFVQNDSIEGETSVWAYVYTEPHVIDVVFNRALR